jgi:HEPN domain-containing protein
MNELKQTVIWAKENKREAAEAAAKGVYESALVISQVVVGVLIASVIIAVAESHNS